MGTARAAGEPSGAFQAGSVWAPLPQCWQIHPMASQKGTESQVLTRPWRKGTRVCCRACEAAPPPSVAMSPGAPRGQPQCGQGPMASSLSPKSPLLPRGIRGLTQAPGVPCQHCAAGLPKAPLPLGGQSWCRAPKRISPLHSPEATEGGRQAKPGAD